jgi:predicted metal-dependent enzyme (double-stranded beta helix superfamily)
MTITTAGTPGVNRFTPTQLLRTARLFATDPELGSLLDATAPQRTWRLLDATAHLQIWVLSWPPGTGTGWHDHGSAAGAFLTVEGTLGEQSWSGGASHERLLTEGEGRTFGPRHIHTVANVGPDRALSVHVYSPALTQLTRYAVAEGRLLASGTQRAGEDW